MFLDCMKCVAGLHMVLQKSGLHILPDLSQESVKNSQDTPCKG